MGALSRGGTCTRLKDSVGTRLIISQDISAIIAALSQGWLKASPLN